MAPATRSGSGSGRGSGSLPEAPELRDHIATFKRLAQLYATVRNAYSEKVGFLADLAYKTQRLVEQGATQHGLGQLTKSITFDVKTLEAIRKEGGPDEGKVINLVRGLRKEADDNPDAAPILQSLKDRAEGIVKDLEHRKTTGLAAIDLLAALAAQKDRRWKKQSEAGCLLKRSVFIGSFAAKRNLRVPASRLRT